MNYNFDARGWLFLLLIPTNIAPGLSVVSFFPHILSPVDRAGGNVREEVVEDGFDDEEYDDGGEDDGYHRVIVNSASCFA